MTAAAGGAPPTVGIDVGGTKILGVVLDRHGQVVAEERRDTVDHGRTLVDDLEAMCEQLLADIEALGDCDGPTVKVGVGVPGLVDLGGKLRFAPNLLAANGVEVRSDLQARLGARAEVSVDNDATCAAAGEGAYGASAGRSDVLLVTLGTGIGGGIVSGGRVLRGATNFSAEIGHVVVDTHGPPCGCGRRGCWERYASGSGLGRIARDAAYAGKANRVTELAGGDPEAVRGEHVVSAVAEDDDEARAIMAEFAWWLALGLGNLANILDPEMIVLGGGLVRAGEALFEPVRKAFVHELEGAEHRPSIPIVPATLGDRGGAIGAAVLGQIGISGLVNQ
ncbi:MAG TPA: ROK family protein [Acidimicrobiales bacterium]|jgi:glucokinase|nr:ROK family protein [Acidimicrobiales bacterium]